MLEAGVKYINEAFDAPHVTPEQLDLLLADGWRHFGTYFFRYSLGIYDGDIRLVIPLRVRLERFSTSKNQRRVLKQNTDLDVAIRPAEITDEAIDLFDRHKRRFKSSVPDSIFDFLSDEPATIPCEAMEVCVRHGDRLVAVSYFDIGANSVSAVYGMFDLEFSDRSLGIFTMLKEIEFARENGRHFYYQGYAYEGESFYDYKKRFRGTETFDWKGRWKPLELMKSGTVDEEIAADDADRADESGSEE